MLRVSRSNTTFREYVWLLSSSDAGMCLDLFRQLKGAQRLMDSRLILCLHAESQEQIWMALDYWARSLKDGEWVWAEPVREIASRYKLKDSVLLQRVREAATAFDLGTRCSFPGHDFPREVSSRSELAVSSRREFLCAECTERLWEQRTREVEERVKALISKQRAFLASLSSPRSGDETGRPRANGG